MAIMKYEARIGELSGVDIVAETIISCLDAQSRHLIEAQSKYLIREVPRDFCKEGSLKEYAFGNNKNHNYVRIKKPSDSFESFTYVEITGNERQIKKTKSKLLKIVGGLRLV